MKSRFLRILTQRDYWPLFGTMSLGAFNDNFLRQALLATLAFGAVGLSDADKSVYGSMATGLMIAPFFLFSSLAGQLADKRPKSELVKLTKVFEAALMAVAAILFSLGLYYELLIVVFLMGLQSTFFGPLKYGLLPEILAAEDLVAGNGLVSGVSFFSIVLGSMAGSWLAGLELGPTVCIPVGLVVVSLLGLFFALRQPASSQATPTLRLEPRLWRSTWEILSAARGRRDIWLAILAISWFWAMGSILLTQAPVMAATVMGATHEVGAFLVTSLALGVAVGSLSVQRLLKGRVSAALAPTSAAALAVLSLALAWSVAALPAAAPLSVSLTDFLADWTRLRVGVLCFLVSAVGGIFVVPLNAILQHRAEPEERARVVAANNVMNSLFIVVGSLLTMLMIKLGLSLAHVFLAVALSAAAAALLTFRFLPEEIVKQLIKTALRLLYRPKIKGLEHFPQEGPALLFPNHTSFIDVALLACWLPRRLSFAIDLHHALRWWIKPFLRLVTAVPVNPAHPLGARALAEALARGEAVVVFPEGRLTTTGGLMKIYEGVGLLATLSPCPLTPVVFQGLEYTRFGRLRSRLRCQPRRLDVSMTVFPPERLETARRPGETRRDLRRRLADHIYDLMALARFRSRDIDQNLFDALKAAVRRCGGGRTIFEDWTRRKLTYGQVLRLSKVLGRALARLTAPGEFVGLMLPNSAPLVGALFGLWAGGRVPVMLNWSQGRGPLLSALKTAQVGLIVTSRRFAENPRIQTLLADSPAKIVFLEDLKLSARAKLAGLLWRGSPAPA
ncbi:MAG: MFS transporter, partial [Deltaproteobacteria bacterium]|nr:MFS transporter [Deltaproteobacteria bacterium]